MIIITNYVNLGSTNAKARSLILNSLEVCSTDRILSRKLLAHVSTKQGNMIAIFNSGIDLDLLESYDSCWPIPDDEDFQYEGATHERTSERLVKFVTDYLTSIEDALIVCEDWTLERAKIATREWLPGSPIACFGDDDVYFLLTNEITDPEVLEDTIRPSGRYQTNICSTCRTVPRDEIPNEHFLDELVRNTKHVFVPAFDGSGFLIWSLEV